MIQNGDFIVSLSGENTKRGERSLSHVLDVLQKKGLEYLQATHHDYLFLVRNKPGYSLDQFREMIGMAKGGDSTGAILSIKNEISQNTRLKIFSRK